MSSPPGQVPGPMSPGLKPPTGIPATFYEPFTLRPYETLEMAACFALTAVLMAGRIYTKLALIKKFSWEDCMCYNH